jgi:hypothetical protein
MCDFTPTTSLSNNDNIEDIDYSPFINNPRIATLFIKDIIKMPINNYANIDSLNTTMRLLSKKYKYSSLLSIIVIS